MPKLFKESLNLMRCYTWQGKTYGPGPADIENEDAFNDLKIREAEYQKHLDEGGTPIAPVTPTLASVPGTKPENMTILQKRNDVSTAPDTAQPIEQLQPQGVTAPSPNPLPARAPGPAK